MVYSDLIKNKGLMMSSKHATRVQRIWRGHRDRKFLRSNGQTIEKIRKRAYSQLATYGHITEGGGYVRKDKKRTLADKGLLEQINKKDHFWSAELKQKKKRNVSFDDHLESRCIGETENHEEEVLFERKSSKMFAEIVRTSLEGKPVHPLLFLPDSKDVYPFFEKAISDLESGKKISLWDGLPRIPTSRLNDMNTCFVKYKFYMRCFHDQKYK